MISTIDSVMASCSYLKDISMVNDSCDTPLPFTSKISVYIAYQEDERQLNQDKRIDEWKVKIKLYKLESNY